MNLKLTAFGAFSLVVFLVASRVLPHPPNFTPVLAVAIFAPYFFRELTIATAMPLASMVFSDFILGMHSYMLWVYGAMAATVVISYYLRRTGAYLARIGSLALGSSLLFFIVTNFGVWLGSGFYAQTAQGLFSCYIAALPFFGNTLLSTMAFCGLFYGVMRMTGLQHRVIKM